METESQIKEHILELQKQIFEHWKAGDFEEIDNLNQYTYQEVGATEKHNSKWLIHVPTSHKTLEINVICDYVVEFINEVKGPCVGEPDCDMCHEEIAVVYAGRFMRESGPFLPDVKGEFGLNLDSITVLSDDRCTSREKTDCEFTKEKQGHPANT